MIYKIFIINILLLLINIYYLLLYKNKYKNSDIYFIKFSNKAFKDISNMLKSQFSYKKNEKKNIFNFNNNKTTIKIYFVDSYLYVKNNLIL